MTLISVFLVPYAELYVQLDFHINRKAREEVIQKVKNGKLRPNVSFNSDLIRLPSNYASLSDGGNIKIERNENELDVLFFTARGIDSYVGLVYKESAGQPDESTFLCSFLVDLKQFDKNWFWITCT